MTINEYISAPLCVSFSELKTFNSIILLWKIMELIKEYGLLVYKLLLDERKIKKVINEYDKMAKSSRLNVG